MHVCEQAFIEDLSGGGQGMLECMYVCRLSYRIYLGGQGMLECMYVCRLSYRILFGVALEGLYNT